MNGKAIAGVSLEDAAEGLYLPENNRKILRLSQLREVVRSDIHALNNENVTFL